MTPECEDMELTATPVNDERTAELLRLVRNQCKDGFAHDNEEITAEAQAAWWVLWRGRVKAWLYLWNDALVGYGLLRPTEDGRWWSSVAVLPEYSGRGYGGGITADLVRRIEEPTWGQARLDQPAAMRLHRAVDWEEVERDDRIVTYRTLPHVYSAVLADWAEHGMAVT